MKSNQRQHDLGRDSYDLILPKGLSEDRVIAFANSIGRNLAGDVAKFGGVPTMVFEVIGTDRGITHRLRVPSRDAEYLIGQLEAHVPGIDITPTPEDEDPDYTFGVRLYETNPERLLSIKNARDHSTKILKAVQIDEPGERVILQWVITHSELTKYDSAPPSRPSFMRALIFGVPETDKKPPQPVDEQQFVAAGRIAAVANDEKRAQRLIMNVLRSLQSENSDNKIYAKPVNGMNLTPDVSNAATPIKKLGNLISVTELVSLIGWPIGDPDIPGVSQGAPRRLPASEIIPRQGRILGHSNVPGRERPVALDYDNATEHMFIGGRTGQGKTVQMANSAYADMHNDFGVIVIDASSSESTETMFNRTLQYIPKHRIDDVITIHVAADTDNPVGFNLFDQGAGRGVIDQIVGVFETLYPMTGSGVAVRDLLYHGLWTLIEHGDLTFVDLAPLITPRNPAEIAWAEKVKRDVTSPELIEFWERMKGMRPTYAETLHNKLWQLSGRPEIKAMIGQTKSTVKIRDVLENNKILLVSLSGLPKDSAELLGSLLTSTIWSAAQSMQPKRPNFLYLDEFQVSANVQDGLDDMLARARKHGLGITLATQYIETISRELKTGIINNTGTRVIYSTSSTEANTWIPEFGGRKLFSENDFTQVKKHHAIATIQTSDGVSPPVTIKALKPYEPTGVADLARDRSRQKYGRPAGEVRQEIEQRKRDETQFKPKKDGPRRPNFGPSPYEPKPRDDEQENQ